MKLILISENKDTVPTRPYLTNPITCYSHRRPGLLSGGSGLTGVAQSKPIVNPK